MNTAPSLRDDILRLAYEHPNVRTALLHVVAKEFPTQKSLQEYLKEHPNADKSKHSVKETDGGGKSQDDAPSEPAQKVKVKVDKKRLKEVQPEVVKEYADYPADAGADDIAPEHREQLLQADFKLTIVGDDARQALSIAKRLKEGIQKGADYCKMNPPACQGNKGLTRDKMPQIESGDSVKKMLSAMPDDKEYEQLTKKVRDAQKSAKKRGKEREVSLKTLIPDGKKRDAWLSRAKGEAMVQAGADPKSDEPILKQMIGQLAKNGVKTSEAKVPVGMLKATQNEILADKAFGMASGHLKGKDHKDRDFDITKGDPIVVSRDGHILDGHHRWAAMLLIDPTMDLNVKVVDMDMDELLQESQAVGGVYKADFAGIPLPGEQQKDYKAKAKSKFKSEDKKPSGGRAEIKKVPQRKNGSFSLRVAMIHLARERADLRPYLLAALKQADKRKITVEISGYGSHLGVRVEDIEGSTPWGEDIGQVAHLDASKNGKLVMRAAVQYAQEHKQEMEAMETGDKAVGAIDAHVYKTLGKSPRWSYIQLPM